MRGSLSSKMRKHFKFLTVICFTLSSIIAPTECRYQEYDAKKHANMQKLELPPLIPQYPTYSHYAVTNPPPVSKANLCAIDRSAKLLCHCIPDSPDRKAEKAICHIIQSTLFRKDSDWHIFHTQTYLEHLKIIVQNTAKLTYIPVETLATLKKLQILQIEYGQFNEMPSFAFSNLTELRNISLLKNEITGFRQHAFANHPNLLEINLSNNRITEINREVFVELPEIVKLNFHWNKIQMIHDGAFEHLDNLRELNLDGNEIAVPTKEMFRGLGRLQTLRLSQNAIEYVGDSVFDELWSLENLYMYHNDLMKLSERAFDGLNSLRILNLKNNKLKSLDRAIFSGVTALLTLNLNDNKLETLTYSNILPLMDNLVNSTSVLLLQGNNLICDCRLLWVYDLKNRTKNMSLKQTLEQLLCVLPTELMDMYESKLVTRPLDYYDASDSIILEGLIKLVDINYTLLPCPPEYNLPNDLPLLTSLAFDNGIRSESSFSIVQNLLIVTVAISSSIMNLN